jgi:hypothetical protein
LSQKREAEQSGPKQHRVLIKHLADSLEAYNGGSIDRLTTTNPAFDAKFNNRYAELIASVKERGGRASSDDGERRVPAARNDGVKRKSDCGLDGEKSAIHKDGGSQTAFTPSRGLIMVASDAGGVDDEAISPSVSTDSEKTVETPQKIRNNRKGSSSPPPGSKKKTAGNRVSSKKSTPLDKEPDSHSAFAAASFAATSSARISSLGPWVCDACTFDNLRNISRNSRCEMCDSVRPKESASDYRKFKDVEVVNIDC